MGDSGVELESCELEGDSGVELESCVLEGDSGVKFEDEYGGDGGELPESGGGCKPSEPGGGGGGTDSLRSSSSLEGLGRVTNEFDIKFFC